MPDAWLADQSDQSRDRTVNDPWLQGRERRVIQTQVPDNAGTEIFHHDVNRWGQFAHALKVVLIAKVYRHALLARVEMTEIGTFAAYQRLLLAHVFTADRLDLDHFGAAVGKESSAVGTGNDPGQIEDADPIQWF